SASISDPVFPHRKCGLSRERFSVRHRHKRKRPCPSASLSAPFNQIGCWSDYLRSCRWVCRRVGIRRAAERRNRSPRYLRQTRPHALYPRNDHDVALAADPLFAAEAELHFSLEYPDDLLIGVTVRLDMDTSPDAPPYDHPLAAGEYAAADLFAELLVGER